MVTPLWEDNKENNIYTIYSPEHRCGTKRKISTVSRENRHQHRHITTGTGKNLITGTETDTPLGALTGNRGERVRESGRCTQPQG